MYTVNLHIVRIIHDCKCIAGIESRQLTILYECLTFWERRENENKLKKSLIAKAREICPNYVGWVSAV